MKQGIGGETLHDLAGARDILDEWFREHEGEVTPELDELMTALDGKIEEKIERVALYAVEMAHNAQALRNNPIVLEAARLIDLAKVRENRAKSLKDGYLLPSMRRLGRDKINGIAALIYLQSNSQDSVDVMDKGAQTPTPVDAAIEQEVLFELSRSPKFKHLVRTTTTYAVDRGLALVLSKDKAGRELLALAGIRVERGQHVRIK